MSTTAKTTIGFDRKIEIEWLDAVAGCVATGQAPEDVRKFLWTFCEGVVAGGSVHSGRGKTLTVLSRIWVIVPEQARPLRKAALQCIGSATSEERGLRFTGQWPSQHIGSSATSQPVWGNSLRSTAKPIYRRSDAE